MLIRRHFLTSPRQGVPRSLLQIYKRVPLMVPVSNPNDIGMPGMGDS
jgi:hypothetical protein